MSVSEKPGKNQFRPPIIIILVLLLVSLSCSLGTSGSPDAPGEQNVLQDGTEECPCATYDPEFVGTQECVCPPDWNVTREPTQETSLCPSAGETMYLYPEYDLTWENEDGNVNWYLPQWWDHLVLQANEPEDLGEVAIISIQEPGFQYFGKMSGSGCSLDDGIGETSFSASGYCMQGVIYLNIVEVNAGWSGTLICPEAVVPMSFVGGESAMAFEFAFTYAEGGTRVEIPFEGGSGYRAFTLTTTELKLPPTPTPSEDDIPVEPIPTPEG